MARRQAAATSWARMFRASGGDCTRDTTVGRRHVAATPRTPRTSGSGGDRTHIDLFKRQVPSQCRPHFLFWNSELGTRSADRKTRIMKNGGQSFFLRSELRVPSSEFKRAGQGRNRTPQAFSRRFWRPSTLPDVKPYPFGFSPFFVPHSAFRIPSLKYPVAVTIRLQLPEKQWS
jgi:hypothetical protein